ncbi:TIGR00730 family Rossman fold protein [Microbacterium koreense]|uniref:TIGR00730 family Rossman fold protein n=1 Tax=Microbacterium koreense TaxID=323761 RepID=A0ABW2ZTF4_9MICO
MAEHHADDPIPAEVTDALRRVIDEADIETDADLVARILATGIGLGRDDTDRLDLKITSAALSEMRAAFRLFAPYRGVPKVTIFGSARTQPSDGQYIAAGEIARALAERGWMVVTGAGPGIMQAAAEGAGPERSLGVSIRLPFEEKPNEVIGSTANNVSMKYFFTRKLMLVKESHGFVCVPGGFGTLDEMFELLTLQQTGKAEPTPIVLLDAPGGTFWEGLRRFVDEHLVGAGVISPDDFDRVLVTDSVAAADDEITGFWRNYDSLRWVGRRLVLRLRAEPTDAEVAALNDEFAFLVAEGSIECRGPLRAEIADDDRLDLPRLVFVMDQFRVGSLYRLIRAINGLGSAPQAATAR